MNSFLIYKILKKRNIPLVIEQNDFVGTQLSKKLGYHFLFTKVLSFIDRVNTHNCDGIVSVSVGLMRKLARAYALPESKFTVIENGADPERCRPLHTEEMRRKFGLPETGFVVGYADNFRYARRRLETILKAGLILKEEGYNLKYVLINEGEAKELEVIKDLTKGYSLGEDLFLFNKLDYFEFPKIVNTFDIALMLYEDWKIGCSPIKFFEYLFCGIPVICTSNVHENTYFPTRVGFRIKSLRVSELAEALRKALSESKDIKEEILLHREELIKRHSWLSCAKRLEKFFQAKIKS
jgi:glycosyltransferase involved in cell wall biosynthesis